MTENPYKSPGVQRKREPPLPVRPEWPEDDDAPRRPWGSYLALMVLIVLNAIVLFALMLLPAVQSARE